MVRLNSVGDILAEAQALAAQGFQVLPAKHRDKFPVVEWTKYQKTRTDKMLDQWFAGRTLNVWIMTGQMSKCIVIDCDSEEADAWWRERLGDEVLDSTASVRTTKGRHYYFKIPEGYRKEVTSFSVHVDDLSFDFRADGTGVIAPPSIHNSGHKYTWERPWEDAIEATPEMLDGTYRDQAPRKEAEGDTKTGTGGVARSMLSSLLASPPGGEGSGRNDWLARVAGHYAKTYRNQEDLYRLHCEQANASMGDPLSETEFAKTVDSIWKGEHKRNEHRALDQDCGWLVGSGCRLLTQVRIKDGENSYREDLAEYGDFNIIATGREVDKESGAYNFAVTLTFRGPNGNIEDWDTVLLSDTLGDERKLKVWLAQYGRSIWPPNQMWPREGSPTIRLIRYLNSQNPPQVKIVETLGWDQELLDGEGGFVTHEGVITSYGLLAPGDASVATHRKLRKGAAKYHYGFFGKREQALATLSEIMTFHDPMVTTVYGAWWAACLVKPQLEEITSLFPFMAIEAPSESGKTNGFFPMMVQLSGNNHGEMQPTKPVLRDMAASHRNGITWVDDLDDPQYLTELLRAATSGGTLAKMAEDRESIADKHIVAPIMISGEALGMGMQKALVDRAVLLNVPSPIGRMSLYDPSKPQWDDIIDVKQAYAPRGGLSAISGHVVQAALEVVPQVTDAVREGKYGHQGRAGDKVAVLRAGARLLDYLLATTDGQREDAWAGRGTHALRLERWITPAQGEVGMVTTTNENALTLRLVPWALRAYGMPEEPLGWDDRVDTPVYIEGYNPDSPSQSLYGGDITIWVSVSLLADAWEQDKRGRIEKRTEAESALKQQADAMELPSFQKRIKQGGKRRSYYRKITGETAVKILDRVVGQ